MAQGRTAAAAAEAARAAPRSGGGGEAPAAAAPVDSRLARRLVNGTVLVVKVKGGR